LRHPGSLSWRSSAEEHSHRKCSSCCRRSSHYWSTHCWKTDRNTGWRRQGLQFSWSFQHRLCSCSVGEEVQFLRFDLFLYPLDSQRG
jgi:hypothetical protein